MDSELRIDGRGVVDEALETRNHLTVIGKRKIVWVQTSRVDTIDMTGILIVLLGETLLSFAVADDTYHDQYEGENGASDDQEQDKSGHPIAGVIVSEAVAIDAQKTGARVLAVLAVVRALQTLPCRILEVLGVAVVADSAWSPAEGAVIWTLRAAKASVRRGYEVVAQIAQGTA